MHTSLLSSIWLMASLVAVSAQEYQPCPLLRSYYPPPTINKSSDTIQAMSVKFTGLFDNLIESGGSDDFGTITPNSTSFSIVLFSGTDDDVDDPIFFAYHYQTTDVLQAGGTGVGLDTIFPLGSLTQLFTVYTWLIQLGDGHWDDMITTFLTELDVNISTGTLGVDWNKVTVGALAGQMSGIARESNSCILGEPCDYKLFVDKFANTTPYTLPDTTPIISNAAFQILAFALERNVKSSCNNSSFASILSESILQPLNMTRSGLLHSTSEALVYGENIQRNLSGEPAALSLLSTTRDLARAGHAMLSSQLIPEDSTRRWLQPVADTSNLRNGVGRPWEIYHAGQYANSSILDIFTKTETVGAYSSYYGISPDLNAGFSILAHDTSGTAPDLNVYADVVSLAVLSMEQLAAKQAIALYSGNFTNGNSDIAVFDASDDGPGLSMATLIVGGVDLRNNTAVAAGIALENLDFRLYPSSVAKGEKRLFVVVLQDKSAPVDMDTPTCITWQDVGSLGNGFVEQVVFQVDESNGSAKSMTLLGMDNTTLLRVD